MTDSFLNDIKFNQNIVTLNRLQSRVLSSLMRKYGDIVRYNPQALALALFDQSINASTPLGDEGYAQLVTILFSPKNAKMLKDYLHKYNLNQFTELELQAFLNHCHASVQLIIDLARN